MKYGEETAINVGIARDPDAHESTDEDFAKARPALQVDPELVQAYNRGDLRIRPDLVNGPGDALRDHLAAKGITQKQLAKGYRTTGKYHQPNCVGKKGCHRQNCP